MPIEDFNWRDKSKGTRRSECKFCHSEFMKKKYRDKKDLVNTIKFNMKCAKCGETRFYMLDFHHINENEKDRDIARLTSNKYRIDAILNEIAKCVVLCSNCHREFHYLNKEIGTTLETYLNIDIDSINPINQI